MEEDILNIEKEDLNDLSVEELVDLKIKIADMLQKVDDLIAQCDEVL